MAAVTVPDWVTRSAGDVAEQFDAIGQARFAGRERHEAMLAAMSWALYGGGGPISGSTWPSYATARVEADAALFVAHRGHAPRAEQWTALGHPSPPRMSAGDTAEWGYGTWRVLAWLLGDTPAAPPTEDTARWPGGRLPDAQRLEVDSAFATRWA
jgi:hypothetical protein